MGERVGAAQLGFMADVQEEIKVCTVYFGTCYSSGMSDFILAVGRASLWLSASDLLKPVKSSDILMFS